MTPTLSRLPIQTTPEQAGTFHRTVYETRRSCQRPVESPAGRAASTVLSLVGRWPRIARRGVEQVSAADEDLRYPTITDSLIRSRSGGLIAALTFSTLAAGLLQICLPLELRQLRASPNQIGLTLAMFGFGMFAFEWLWGVLADRYGYGGPLVVSQLLYAGCIVLLARADSVLLIAISYLLASGWLGLTSARASTRGYEPPASLSFLRNG